MHLNSNCTASIEMPGTLSRLCLRIFSEKYRAIFKESYFVQQVVFAVSRRTKQQGKIFWPKSETTPFLEAA
jgi:hypothetical protein